VHLQYVCARATLLVLVNKEKLSQKKTKKNNYSYLYISPFHPSPHLVKSQRRDGAAKPLRLPPFPPGPAEPPTWNPGGSPRRSRGAPEVRLPSSDPGALLSLARSRVVPRQFRTRFLYWWWLNCWICFARRSGGQGPAVQRRRLHLVRSGMRLAFSGSCCEVSSSPSLWGG
jgi:hypothetical protein